MSSSTLPQQSSSVGPPFLKWIASKAQPCLFGRLAAGASDLVDVCILSEDDLGKSDREINRRLYSARRTWKERAANGDKSALIVVAASPRILSAAPDGKLLELSLRLASLLLEQDVLPDRTYRDYVLLFGTDLATSREFGVGVDYFAAAGDQRWWHDHRMPGGMAFVLNSPGHMALSRRRREVVVDAAEEAVRGLISAHPELTQTLAKTKSVLKVAVEEPRTVIDSPSAVHRYAMLTIAKASEQGDASQGATWERATWLVHRKHDTPVCPHTDVATDRQLKGYDHRGYLGWYHTDHTIRSDFFAGTAGERPPNLRVPKSLDFTYIFERTEEDYGELTEGLAINVPSRKSKGEIPDA